MDAFDCGKGEPNHMEYAVRLNYDYLLLDRSLKNRGNYLFFLNGNFRNKNATPKYKILSKHVQHYMRSGKLHRENIQNVANLPSQRRVKRINAWKY
jgi:hypothetical protein